MLKNRFMKKRIIKNKYIHIFNTIYSMIIELPESPLSVVPIPINAISVGSLMRVVENRRWKKDLFVLLRLLIKIPKTYFPKRNNYLLIFWV